MSIEFKINDIPVSAEAGEMIVEVAARYGIEMTAPALYRAL